MKDDDPGTAGFRPATGMSYVRFLRRLHERLLFDWYMEIGCRTGRSFATVRGKTIAVDPFFRVETNALGPKPQLHLFQQTSDDFFASDFLGKAGIKLSFSFLDGMHLFEFLLRDFIGAERNSRLGAVIALHDCCPSSLAMTTRDLTDLPQDAWTGDVWKLIPILQEFRPDLTLTVLDAKPTGIVLISGVNPASRVLQQNYDKIVARYHDVDLPKFGVASFFGSFAYVEAQPFLANGLALFDAVQLDSEAALTPRRITP